MEAASGLSIRICSNGKEDVYVDVDVSPPSSAFVSALQSPYISPSTTPTLNLSDDIPSTSYSESDHARVSFSFPVPRFSFATNAKLRTSDVFIGFHGQNSNLLRFTKWLKSELELQGIACFVADRATYSDTQSHEIADRVICSASFGLLIITTSTFLNFLSLEEIRFFAQKKNLIPIFFGTLPAHIPPVDNEVIDGLIKSHEFKLEATETNWRSCVSKTTAILQAKLGRRSLPDSIEPLEELPFTRNTYFVGRDKEMSEMQTVLFEDEHVLTRGGKFINLELGEATKGKRRRSSVICINGIPGIGKTELALEFAYRHSQRYKKVFWVGGEARYLRQNLLNLSISLGLDVSADADPEKERGRIRSFEEQEIEAFKRVKRELFSDAPYLLIIDNLETEKEWWEGKDMRDLIPKNTGGSHVIITTRLSNVMNFNTLQIITLPLSDAMLLMRGRRKIEYSTEEFEILSQFDEKLARLTFGLWIIGSLLSELAISPSGLYEAVNQIPPVESSSFPYLSLKDEEYCKDNPFLTKLVSFCFAVLHNNFLPSRMLIVGAWFAPAPISANLLAAAAENMPAVATPFRKWSEFLIRPFAWCGGCGLAPQSEEDSAHILVKLGLARKCNKQSGYWIQFHPITQVFARRKDCLLGPKATVQGIRKIGNSLMYFDHHWASAFLVFGFKSEPPLVELKAIDMVVYIKKTAVPLAIRAFTTFSRCNSALELLKVCTTILEEVEKSFVSQIQDWCHGSLCWKKRSQKNHRIDEYVWQDVTLLKATLLETRAKLLSRGGNYDNGEDLCRTCISIRTVMLGHNHALTLAAQETLAKLVRMRSKI